MTEKQFNRTKLSDVMSFEAFQVLDKIIIEKQSEQRYPIDTVKYFAGSKGANLLTKVCLEYIRGTGGHAERVSTTGMPRKNKYGEMIWTRSQAMVGSADIHAVIDGRMVAVEIKYGRDKMSSAQRLYQKRIESAGGKYIIVRQLDDLINKYYDTRN